MTELPIDVIYSGDDAASGLGGLADLAGGTLAVAFGSLLKDAIEGALGALSNFVNQAAQAEVQQAGLVALLNSTAGAAGLTQDAVNRLANQFRDLAGGSDEAVVAIEEIGIRSGQVSASQMPAFIKAVLDLGSVMGSTTSAATLLARAQDDPAGAFARLERLTGVYDLALKENIKTMVKHGDTAGAVAAIMEYVARTTGGAAAAAADTASGKWAILTNHFEDFFKALAEHVLPVIERLLDVAIPVLDSVYQSFENTFIPLIDQASAWGEGIINALASGMASAAQAVVDVISQLGAIIASWMQPGSPPKFLPNLDKWGEEAVNVYMGGWQNFDKSVFDELYKAIKGGLPTQEIQEYADATKALTQAQSALNDITEHYDTLLNPLNAKLKGIQNQQKKLQDADELTRLRMIINSNTGYSASAKQQAALQIQEILTREQISAIQDEKDTAVGAAKDKVSAAQTVADQLKASIDLQLQYTQATGPNGAAGAAHKLAAGLAHIAQAAAGAGAALKDMEKNKEAFGNALSGLGGGKQASSGIETTLSELKRKIEAFVEGIKTDLRGVAEFFSPLTKALTDAKGIFDKHLPEMEATFKGLLENMKHQLGTEAPQLTKDFQRLIDAMGKSIEGLLPIADKVLPSALNIVAFGLREAFAAEQIGFVSLMGLFSLDLIVLETLVKLAGDVIKLNWKQFQDDVKEGFRQWFDEVKGVVQTDLDLIAGVFDLKWSDISAGEKKILEGMKKTVEEKLPQIEKAVKDTLTSIATWLGEQIVHFNDAGANLIKGLKDGVLGGVQGLIDAVKSAISQAIAAAHDLLNSHSPSLVFAGIGENMMAGLAMGITNNIQQPVAATKQATSHTINAAYSIQVDARGSNDPSSVEEAGYEGAQRALQEAGYRADQYTRMGTVGA